MWRSWWFWDEAKGWVSEFAEHVGLFWLKRWNYSFHFTTTKQTKTSPPVYLLMLMTTAQSWRFRSCLSDLFFICQLPAQTVRQCCGSSGVTLSVKCWSISSGAEGPEWCGRAWQVQADVPKWVYSCWNTTGNQTDARMSRDTVKCYSWEVTAQNNHYHTQCTMIQKW